MRFSPLHQLPPSISFLSYPTLRVQVPSHFVPSHLIPSHLVLNPVHCFPAIYAMFSEYLLQLNTQTFLVLFPNSCISFSTLIIQGIPCLQIYSIVY
jgi:hypothetical protein